MTDEYEKFLCKHLDKNLVINTKQACNYVKKIFKVIYTVNGMVKTLKRLGYVYKKPKRVPSKLLSLEKQLKCYEKIDKILDSLKPKKTAFFFDWAGFRHKVKIITAG